MARGKTKNYSKVYGKCSQMKATLKVRLKPTKSQEQQFISFANAARFVYNYSLGLKIKMYEEGEVLYLADLMREIRLFKYADGNEWLREVPEAIQKQSVKDMLTAFTQFYKRGCKGFPKFKKKEKTKLSFYQRTDCLRRVDSKHIKLTGIKDPVRVNRDIGKVNYQNPRIAYDNKYWYLTFSYEIEELNSLDLDVVIGVDLGVRKLAVTSEGRIYKNINETDRVKMLERRKARLQRKLSKKYQINKRENKLIKTNNILKLEQQIRLIDRRLKNIRETHIHTITNDLVKTKPSIIVIEDLNVSQMLKDKYLSKSIKDCCFYKFRSFLEYKCRYYGIRLTVADRYYASSKICSVCNSINTHLGSNEIYICPHCGRVIDRDLNAAINLRNYGLSLIA